MKNVEVIDGALNSRFEIYEVSDADFERLFGDQNEIYLDDVGEAIQNDTELWNRVYAREVERSQVRGIHGILHTHPRVKTAILEQQAAR